MKPTRAQVVAKVRQVFPHEDPDEIMAILDQYEGFDEGGRARVQLAILKVSGGNKLQLLDALGTAIGDYRDILVQAEYPEFGKIGFVGVEKLSPEDVRELKVRDLRQYLSWLQDTDNPDMSGYDDWLGSSRPPKNR